MVYTELPRIGWVKFTVGDWPYILLSTLFIVLGLDAILASLPAATLLSLLAPIVQALCGVALYVITIVSARQRVEREEWVNPVRQLEAYWNHAGFEN